MVYGVIKINLIIINIDLIQLFSYMNMAITLPSIDTGIDELAKQYLGKRVIYGKKS
jgi:hypothetical protein